MKLQLPKVLDRFRRGEKPPELDELQSGAATVLDLISPASVERKFREHVVVDGVYHAYLYVTGYGYGTRAGNGWLNALVEAGEGVNLNFILKRQQRDKVLSKISSATMINRARMRDVGDTRADFEELDSAIASGLYLKDGMNREMLDFYYMHTVIEVTAGDEAALEQRVSSVQTLCTSIDIQCKRCDFKHAEAFLSCLPVLALDADIERKARRNVLSDAAAAAFPFSSFEICDQNGIMLGINQHNRSVAVVDIFDSAKYSNANMSVMGMSGAGKTFLLQLMALRLRMQDTQVYILAPLKGHEFRPACEAIGGKYIKLSPSSRDCINIMEIRKTTLDTDHELGGAAGRDDSILADKIQKLHIFFSLLKPNMTDEERNFLDVAMVECYRRFGITHDNASIAGKQMPILKDLYDILALRPETNNLSLVINRFVSGSASRLGQATNVDLNNKYIVLDISEMSKDLLPLGMFLSLDFVWDEAKKSRIQKKVVMLDELWCLIGAGSNSLAADYVLEIFKVIRGYGGAAIAATQDINDFFALEDGKYGKGIINSSRLKFVLQLEEDEAFMVQKVLSLSDEETMQIVRNQRGQGLFCANRNKISVEIRASVKEYDLISTQRSDLERKKRDLERSGGNAV
jgi:type IV secretory pathway VirB4 component